jgi:hypothetical protein
MYAVCEGKKVEFGMLSFCKNEKATAGVSYFCEKGGAFLSGDEFAQYLEA